ncbi:MAG: PorT family protein [Tannerellaceae bacterium]|jgi:hypothetical protein|nr:PorT family protein [Tannerellaceae bacterium]
MGANLCKWILVGILGLTAVPVIGQVALGVRAGLARTSYTQKVDLDYQSGSRFGYSMAVMADIPFYHRFSFRPEIAVENQGGKYFTYRNESGAPRLKYKSNYYSLQIPLNIAFNIPITGVRMAVFGGPAPNFHLSGKMKVEGVGEEPSYDEKKMKTFDLGINSGISVEYKHVFFSIDAFYGTLDRRVDKYENESRVYHNNITFSLGYFFRPG